MPGSVIKKYREVRNYSQKYVATKMGISQNAYSKIENNLTQLTVQHLKDLSRILETPITDLMKDNFEIHRPVAIHKGVTKTELLVRLENLQKRIHEKHLSKHDSYTVALSLIIAAENSVSLIH